MVVTTEVVAPVGRMDHLSAALEGGADAVYVGLQGFSARPDSASLNVAAAGQVCRVLHTHDKRLYLAVNAQIYGFQMREVDRLIDSIRAVGPDAVILSDLGLLRVFRKADLDIPLHASNLLGVYNVQTVDFLIKHGIQRVVLNSNIFLDEIADVTRAYPAVKFEIIAYGGVCYNDCRRCRLPHSEAAGRMTTGCQEIYLSDVRVSGVAAAPWRMLGVDDTDLSSLVPTLLSMGITAYKIEGRTRDANYVLQATRQMRQALDNALNAPLARHPFTYVISRTRVKENAHD